MYPNGDPNAYGAPPQQFPGYPAAPGVPPVTPPPVPQDQPPAGFPGAPGVPGGNAPAMAGSYQTPIVGRPTSHAVLSALLLPFSLVSAVTREYVAFWWTTTQGKVVFGGWLVALLTLFMGEAAAQVGSVLFLGVFIGLIYLAVAVKPTNGPIYTGKAPAMAPPMYGYGAPMGYGAQPITPTSIYQPTPPSFTPSTPPTFEQQTPTAAPSPEAPRKGDDDVDPWAGV